MNSRQRVLAALNHQEPDRVPFDLGATLVSSINHETYRGVRRLLGLDADRPVQWLDVVQQIAVVEDDVRRRLGIDTRGVLVRPSSAWDPTVKEDETSNFLTDPWGAIWRKPKATGLYYDMTYHPLQGVDDPAALDSFPWPDGRDPARWGSGLVEEAKALHDAGEYAVIMGNMGVTSGLFQTSTYMLGFYDTYCNLAGAPAFMDKLLRKLAELDLAFWESFLPVVGPYLDVVMYADDFAGQDGLLISLDMYRRLFKPRYREIFDMVRRHAPHVKIFFHSCGAIRDLIPELIEVGVDIVNPVQVSAAHMETRALKRDFGRDIVFWGGGVDTQRVLPRGTPAEVKAEVKRRIEDLAPGGGFIFNTVHNIQGDVPPENVIAMVEALHEYGKY